jgi:predicted ester cyclase
MKLSSAWYGSIICGVLAIVPTQTAVQAQGPPLPQPESMTVDRSLSKAEAAQMIKTARLFYAFWDTGNAEYASASVDNDFRDNTLPEGRPQGPKGLLYASQTFRTAVPDLHCKIEDLLVSGDKVTARLTFTGTSYQASIKTIETATGTRPVGFNAFWLRGTPRTLEILQDLGFIYHIDDISRDEPFLVPVRNKPFVVVPYTIHTNDIVNYEGRHWTGAQFASELKYEFDQLYAEAATRRRMMSVSAHDRITGRPARTKVLEEFIVYAQKQPGVVFLRKDQIARFALESSATPREGSLM